MAEDVLVIGTYPREHAIAWKLKQSPRVGKVYIAPGNGGTGNVAENVPIGVMEFEKLAEFAIEKKISLTVVGPENPLGEGIVDVFQARGLRIWGPTKAAAQIESSKAFSKQLMADAGIPTAEFKIFTEHAEALAYVREKGAPIVIKVDGMVFGKGAYVCMTMEEAETALKETMLDNVLNTASKVVIEEFLDGQEISIHAISDGKTSIVFPTAQDHKTIGENDTGKMTGGMGVAAPISWVSKNQLADIEARVVRPALRTLADKGSPLVGMLYPGLMMTPKGPRVLEFNARFGCPEAEVYMRLMKSDVFGLFNACIDGTLADFDLEWDQEFAATIIIASGGYPDGYKKGLPITGIEEAEKVPNVIVFHAGTKLVNGQLVTDGGRVLSVSATGSTLKEAIERAYEAVGKIHFENMYYRRDIGAKALSGK
ncbi:phosphoribosylamine--glycine ligase [Candidatus Parcubacteria bacterium]|nr:MAG: phosphoribosylamine--glycine ligase [Candidatus Parcubacteria bacterium]